MAEPGRGPLRTGPSGRGSWRGRSRRTRLLSWVGLGVIAFVVIVAGTFRVIVGRDVTYVPGETLEGLTTTLARELPEDRPRVTFVDATRSAGIDFTHFQGRRTTRLPEDMGSGAAWGDYDRDGWDDLYIVNQAGPLDREGRTGTAPHAKLYRNLGDGTFEDVTDVAGVAHRGHGMGAAWADYDGDGHLDLMVSGYGALTLYRSEGDGTFRNESERAGVDRLEGFWTGVSWADYDRDGDLDAYVTGYVQYEERTREAASMQYDTEQPASINPSAFEPERNLLLRNEADGTFVEVAERAGVTGAEGRSLAAAWSDLDGDGWQDLYVANDVSDNALYRNQGDGTFAEISHEALVADYRGAMGIGVGDMENDGDLDLFITHWIAQENALFVNQIDPARDGSSGGLLQFRDIADRVGLGQVALDFVGWGTSFFDYDSDGRLDLFVANGSTFEREDDRTRLIPMRDQLFWNGGADRGFYNVAAVSGDYFSREYVGRGAAFADYDNDGDVDVFIVNHGGPGILLRNEATPDRAWLQVRLEGPPGNPTGLGARVVVVAEGGAQIREVGAQPSYLSQNSPVTHFGLGSARQVDTLKVRWPSGTEQTFVDVAVRARIQVREEDSELRVEPRRGTPSAGEGPRSRAGPAADVRERVRSFWGLYREATRHRVAERLELAEASYRRALELDPTHEDAAYYLGNVLLDLGRFDEGVEVLEGLTSRNPRSARAHARLGMAHLCRDGPLQARLAEAESALLRAAGINREATGTYLRLAEVALVGGDAPGAEEWIAIVLGSNPESGPAHALLGYATWLQERPEDAFEELQRAVRVSESRDGLVSGEGDTRTHGRTRGAAPRACRGLDTETLLASISGGPFASEAAVRFFAELDRRRDSIRR